ncbi:phthiocerol/phenolphthiocerol synthesis type-I polyketide synthase D [Amycolatopsis arida]|uniref:Phthiocerol/phenolphthiocerol synthesis type-I polyketide synthase D n=1 Tax=Amycolatopsis arida TaxID=587909 RepID=A0A1I5KW07_9PSEU|nr:type I polyketide synthase [Amycolatopsis arida]TDX85849.1 phthiocerol/phenolphthiocerol synthesis type-I polyketide synthase D [Amycolatopsis arida]SFO88816.1 phthiocerol/phenolphthiocerol synthesis type-I polyketide synthase D [Amycolatopsis arida]
MAEPTTEELRRWLVEQVAAACELTEAEIDEHRPLVEYGLSSRKAVELSGELEDLLDRALPTTLLWDHPSIAELAAGLTGEPAPAPSRVPTEPAPSPAATGDDDAIAVIGVGCRLPGGVAGPDRFWRLLTEGGSAISELPEGRWDDYPDAPEGVSRRGGFLPDIAGFDAEFFGIAPREAARMDPQQRMLLEVAWEAVQHAGIAPGSLRGSDTGVFVGISGTEYGARSLADLSGVDAWAGTGAALSIAANRLSYVLDLRGPSLAVDTACSSSLTSVHLAVRSLRAGECGLALVGGANLLLGPAVTANFDQMGITAADGRCKPFSADADGIGRAEGAGLVVLKRLADARADGDRVLAVIRGTATNSDGRSNGLTAPNPDAQRALLRAAYDDAGVDPATVDYVEAHGTGTLLGDPIEARALGAVLGTDRPSERPLLIGSVKSNLGHLEAAAGITGLIKVVLALHHGRVPATVNYAGPNPHIPFAELGLAVVDEERPWPTEGAAVAGVSGFGFGGSNAHVVLQRERLAPETEASPPASRTRLLLGAPDATRLGAHATRLAGWLAGEGAELATADIAHTLARRLDGRCRAAVVGGNTAELVAGLRALASGEDTPAPVDAARGGPVFVFSGHGSQWAGMGRRLLVEEPVFAAAVDRLDPHILAATGRSLRADLEAGIDARTMDHVQPLVFGIQVGLADLWRSHGVRPAAVIGHSFGEVAAAVVAGALTEADGARIVALRSRLLASLAGDGAMALLEVSAEEAEELVRDLPDVDVAVLTAPSQTVVAGSATRVREIVAEVSARGLLAKLVKLDVAAHSPVVDTVTGALREELAELCPATPELPCYGTVLPDPRREPVFDAGYWAANLRRPVRFAAAVAAAVADGHSTFVEVSPHPVLRHALADNGAPVVLSTLRQPAPSGDDEVTHFHRQLARLELAGQAAPRGGAIVDVPPLPWRHERHWLPRPSLGTAQRRDEHPLLGAHVEVPDDGRHVWRADLGAAAQPWLSDHRMDGRPVLPGAAYVELAGAAARAVFDVPAERVAVTGLVMHAPLPLAEHTPVTTVLVPGEGDTGTVTVRTKQPDGSWLTHASAEVAVVPGTSADEFLSEVDTSELREVAVRPLYDRLARLGVRYGPAFAGMTTVRAGRHDQGGRLCAVAEVALPEAAPRHPLLRLHPALLDACLQAFAGALLGPDPAEGLDGAYVPMEFGGVRVYGDPALGRLVHVSVTAPTDGAAGLLGELHLVDDRGRVLLEVTDVFVRSVTGSELAPLTERLLEPRWQPVPAPEGRRPAGPVLVVSDGPTPLAGALVAAGVDVRGGDVDTVDGLSAVVVPLPDVPEGEAALDAAERAVLTVGDAVRALVERGAGRPPRLVLATAGAAAVAGEPGRPALAALRGLVRVLAYEHPELTTTLVDLDPRADLAERAAALATELAATAAPGDDEVAWRGGERFALRLGWVPPVPADSTPPVRPEGGYVVTGGLGGLGLLLAEWLAEHGAGRIVLNGRSAPRPEATAAIERITARGTDVEVVLGDVAEPGVAERLVVAAGRLCGVVHAAAVFDDRTTTRLDADTLHRCWRPKARGAWRLHEATRGRELDWFVGFSSGAALHGLPGQPAYATANAYLEALVALRRAEGLPGCTVSWGTWAEVGAAAGVEVPWLHPIRPAEGLAVLAAVLAEDRASTGALRLNAPRLLTAFPKLAELPFFAELLGDYVVADESTDWPGPDGLRALEPAAARDAAAGQLRARVAGVLGFPAERLDTTAPLPAIGVDSLLAVRIRNAVQHDFGLSLPVSLLLRGASVAEVEQWLLDELGLGTADRPARTELLRVPPRDAAERLVASAWRDVLGSDVGVTQDFYGVGGTRAKAEAVTALLVERSGRELTMSELFEHPTVERMARHLREDERTGSPVRVLRAEGGRAPLFFCHPGGGDTAVYRQLVQLLDPEVPAYGFDRLDGVADVEDRVRRYLPELRAIQPAGPYRIAGWSFGGFLAFELAQQLRGAGERVELLALIDPILPLPNETGLSEVELTERRFARFAEFLETSYGRRVRLPYERLARLGDEDQVQLLIETMLAEGLVNTEVSDAILRHQRTSFLDARSLERYRPEPYPGRVVFFSAAEQVPGGLRDQRFDRTDPARGWDAYCPDLEVITVPGHHLSLLDPPTVDHIGKHLHNLLTVTARPVGSRGA